MAALLWETDNELDALKDLAQQKEEVTPKRVETIGGIDVTYIHDPKQGGRVYAGTRR